MKQDYQKQSHCLGCRLAHAAQPVHIVYENEWVTCLLDIEPFNEGHTLILPKHHYEEWTEVDPLMMEQITKAASLLSEALKNVYKPAGITICQNGGIFNELAHFHMHVIPRFDGDGFTWSETIQAHGAETRLSTTRTLLIQALKEDRYT
ncbi:HIT family protein [Brevibacillus sp. SIMBA_040]|uniref:HIT family protein n=1 Tax=unclassified Brevibacillus TaxID=2684853 RepID=UPI00397C7EB2